MTQEYSPARSNSELVNARDCRRASLGLGAMLQGSRTVSLYAGATLANQDPSDLNPLVGLSNRAGLGGLAGQPTGGGVIILTRSTTDSAFIFFIIRPRRSSTVRTLMPSREAISLF